MAVVDVIVGSVCSPPPLSLLVTDADDDDDDDDAQCVKLFGVRFVKLDNNAIWVEMVVVHRSYVICVSSSGGYRLSACTPHSPLPWFINGICCLSTSFVNQLLNIPLAVAVMASRFRTNRYIHTHNTPRRLFAASHYALNECGKRLSIHVIRLHRCMRVRGMLQVKNFGLVCPGWQYILRSCVFVRFAQT